MSALAERLQQAWYGAAAPPWWTRPLAGLYGAIGALRRWLYRRGVLRSVRLPVPVLVVGNLSVGGTGKTPLTIALVELLRQHGWAPGVVSRGYGGSQRTPALLPSQPDPAVYGDEPCLIHAGGAAVAVGRDRPAAAALLVELGCDVILADDGLQHYRLQRDLEICVIDGARRFGNRRLLPAGPLREPLARLAQVQWRVCNGGQAQPGEVPMQLVGEQLHHLGDGRRMPLAALRGQRVQAVAAIGNPQRFFGMLEDSGLQVHGHVFADHHAYQAADFAFDDGSPLLMTAKDATKCAALARPNWWYLPVRARLPQAFAAQLVERLARLPGRPPGGAQR